MKIRTKILAVSMLALLTACGGGDSKSDKRAGDSMEKTLKKSKAKTKEGRALDVYLDAMNDMADAMETIDDEASAKKAAKKISEITAELEAFTKKHDGEFDDQMVAMALMMGGRRNEFMKTQMRISTSMMKLATQNPEMMQMISEEMDKMPKP